MTRNREKLTKDYLKHLQRIQERLFKPPIIKALAELCYIKEHDYSIPDKLPGILKEMNVISAVNDVYMWTAQLPDIEMAKNVYSEMYKNSMTRKIQYAEFISMTPIEHKKLVDKYRLENTTKFIEKLNNYKANNPKNHKSHKRKSDYLTILNWAVNAVLNPQPPNIIVKNTIIQDFHLTNEDTEKLKFLAKEQNATMSEIIRSLIQFSYGMYIKVHNKKIA